MGKMYLEGMVYLERILLFLQILNFHRIIKQKFHSLFGFITQVVIRINTWDNEQFQLIIDNGIYKEKFWGSQGSFICNNGGISYYVRSASLNYIHESHTSQSLVLLMTSNLDEDPNNESWDFEISKLRLWNVLKVAYFAMIIYLIANFGIILYHIGKIQLTQRDGQLITLNNLLQVFVLVFRLQVELIFQNKDKVLKNSSKMFKTLQNLYSFQTLESQNFNLKIGEQIWQVGQDALSQLIIGCVNSQLVNINNLVLNIDHSSPEIELVMQTENNQPQNAFWGLNVQLVVKIVMEDQKLNAIIVQKNGDFQMVNVFLLLHQNILILESINHKVQKKNFINSLQLYIEELDQTITEIGQKKLIIDKSIIFSSFLISVKCQEKIKIDSFLRNCNQCDNAQISYSNYCLNQSNIVNFSVIFADIVQSEKELIINILQTKVEILQVILLNNIETEVYILKIEL
ncbi:unnamed protein product [Paramecium pentaurelia]|uniref:Transmembrane protein n=1 Tax=Paramecium pentaurelia TaxID=43138 RepID=A0A8S1UVA1_9CILI|nr:unnamed protein product [Paramecium pentaurelia]